MTENIKLIAAVLVVVGVVVGFFNLKYSPHTWSLESSPERPAWLPWFGWALTSLASMVYIAVDLIETQAIDGSETAQTGCSGLRR